MRRRPAMLVLLATPGGWTVALTDGRELARFRGPIARWRAERYLRNLVG